MSTMDVVHLRPSSRDDYAWFGDPVPFYFDGTYHLFYVWDQGHLLLPRVCHAWGHFASKDLVHWQEYPLAIEPLEEASCGSGSIVWRDGVFHAFYLGRYFTTTGIMYETLCHALSTDLVAWTKDANNPISAPDVRTYTVRDWRDGFPIWDEERQQYVMLVTASLRDVPQAVRGCIALLSSKDLERWQLEEPFWAPYIGSEIECPDLFYWNGWWYLVFSGTFAHASGTLYRRSRSMYGPWETPAIDTFDGSLFYAGKTAGNAERRMLFGWIGTRTGMRDNGSVQWGGHGLIRELLQDEQGYLWVKYPKERLQIGQDVAFGNVLATRGEFLQCEDSLEVCSRDGLSYALTEAPSNLLIRFTFKSSEHVDQFGIVLCTDEGLSTGYWVGIRPDESRMFIRPIGKNAIGGAPTLSRPIVVAPDDSYRLTVIVSDSIIEVFVNDRTSLVGRYYGTGGCHIAWFSENGCAMFSNISIRALPTDVW